MWLRRAHTDEALTLPMLAGCVVALLGTAMNLGLLGSGSAKPDARAKA